MLKKPSTAIIILALLFGVPLFSAYFMTKERDPITTDTTNHGTLITPPLDFATLEILDPQGEAISEEDWKGKWLMLYVSPFDYCDSACAENLYNIRQIKQATGKNSSRIERAILTFADTPFDHNLQSALEVDFAGTKHFITTKSNWLIFTGPNAESKRALLENSILLVDPLGNVMMIYDSDVPPMDIFKDLSRLLKLSRIG
jgi:cytochrome oxidase Cu insertion factor (SCO1/SenC/PrrC family)